MGNLNSALRVSAGLTYSKAGQIGVPGLGGADRDYLRNILDGTGTGQANKLLQRRGTIANGANVDLDLAGALTDDFGDAVVFSAVMAIVLKASDANTGNLTFGGAANGFASCFGAATHTLVLQPKGVIVLIAGDSGYAVTAATADILRVGNASGASQDYELTIIGR
jgi:hypothetical protein